MKGLMLHGGLEKVKGQKRLKKLKTMAVLRTEKHVEEEMMLKEFAPKFLRIIPLGCNGIQSQRKHQNLRSLNSTTIA